MKKHKVEKVKEREDKVKVKVLKDATPTTSPTTQDKLKELEERVARLERLVKKLMGE